jgi:hypothetical protein
MQLWIVSELYQFDMIVCIELRARIQRLFYWPGTGLFAESRQGSHRGNINTTCKVNHRGKSCAARLRAPQQDPSPQKGAARPRRIARCGFAAPRIAALLLVAPLAIKLWHDGPSNVGRDLTRTGRIVPGARQTQ